MFAGEKLLCKPLSSSDDFVHNLTNVEKMACMSVRIPLEFNVRTLRSQKLEQTLVENHMHVCPSVDAGFETAITVTPSEPILAEASYLLRTVSRLTALPTTMFFHSVSGNSGQSGEFISDLLVALGSTLNNRRSSRVLAKVGESLVSSSDPGLAQGNLLSSTLGFLTLSCSSSYLYPGSISGVIDHFLSPDCFPLFFANVTSVSWLSTASINDWKPASAFAGVIPCVSKIHL
jgi:hypothetical protein